MKLKYKKSILLVFLGTMGIGILTMALAPRNDEKAETSEKLIDESNYNEDTQQVDLMVTVVPTISPKPTMVPIPTDVPTPTPLPIYPLEEEGYPEIESIVKDYYEAKIYCDIEVLKKLFSNPSDVPSTDQLQKEIMYIEEYQSIACYVKKSYEDGTYIVYVYNEIKFVNIDTAAPAVDRFYLITDSKGDIKIFSGDLDEETTIYYNARLFDADVQELLQETNAKGTVAREKDELLRNFWEGLMSTQEEIEDEDTDGEN